MSELMDSALKYAEAGFAVFPLIPRGKVPATAHGFKDATRDTEQIRKWWTEIPDCNIGIATGQASGGLVVIDVDDGHGDGRGSDSMYDWEHANGKLPDTVTCITGSGGYHYYYYDAERFGNRSGLLHNVDVRAEGGYVVAPPSVHPNGNRYEWDAMSELGTVPIPHDDPQVRKFLAPIRKRDERAVSDNPAVFPEGERTDSLIRLVGTLIDRGLSPEATKAAVIEENRLKCVPPLDDEELEREVFPAITDRGWVPTKPYAKDSDIRLLPKPVVLSDIWADPPPLAPELIKGVLRQGHKMILSAPSKAGKSFALMRLAIGIAEGMKWFGSECKQGRVFYVNMEIDDPSCYNRFRAIYNAMGMNEGTHVENLTVWGLRGFSMPLSDLAPKIIEEAWKNYDAIILDPLYKVMDGDENSNSDIGRMVGQFDRIARETGASVIYAHHFAKGTGGDRDTIDRGAGAGTFSRDPDAILTMTQLDMEDEVNEIHTAWRMEYVLREFPNHKPVSFWWEHPLHRIDPMLDEEAVQTSATKAAKQKHKVDEAKKREQRDRVRQAVKESMNDEGRFLVSDFIANYKWKELALTTAKRWLIDAGYIAEPPKKSGLPSLWKLDT